MTVTLLQGDSIEVLKTLPDGSVQCCVTSPPYFGLRDYGIDGQIGLEEMPQAYVDKLVSVFREVKRVLRDDGTLWLNLGDSYAGSGQGWCKDGEQMAGSLQHGNKGSMSVGYHPPSYISSRQESGIKPKDLIGIPWMVAFALRNDGWYLRQDIIWAKPNPMPESVKDRCTKSHEYIFLLSKNGGKSLIYRASDTMEWSFNPDLTEVIVSDGEERPRWRGYDYYYDADAVSEPIAPGSVLRLSEPNLANQEGSYRVPGKTNGPIKPSVRGFKTKDQIENPQFHGGNIATGLKRNKRSVWTVTTKPYKEAHFATYPPDLIEPCILAGSKAGDIVLDPFNGAGTTGLVATQHGRDYIGIDLNPDYLELTRKRLDGVDVRML